MIECPLLPRECSPELWLVWSAYHPIRRRQFHCVHDYWSRNTQTNSSLGWKCAFWHCCHSSITLDYALLKNCTDFLVLTPGQLLSRGKIVSKMVCIKLSGRCECLGCNARATQWYLNWEVGGVSGCELGLHRTRSTGLRTQNRSSWLISSTHRASYSPVTRILSRPEGCSQHRR